MQVVTGVLIGLIGAFLGSFACAQVWRIRAQQLVNDKKRVQEGKTDVEAPDPKELKHLSRLVRPMIGDRSECLSCNHRLAWYDLVPVISWLSLRGRCRYCRAPIGRMELIAELSLGLVFAISYWFWPLPLETVAGVGALGLWLISCTVMLMLALYDAKWFLLPFGINILLIVLAVGFRILLTAQGMTDPWSLIAAVGILAGLYALFGLFNLVGYGDSIMGIALALFLGRWELAFLTLFLANLLGCLWLVPLAMRRKLHRRMRIPFGPFLIIAAIISMLWGHMIIEWFFTVSGYLFIPLMV